MELAVVGFGDDVAEARVVGADRAGGMGGVGDHVVTPDGAATVDQDNEGARELGGDVDDGGGELFGGGHAAGDVEFDDAVGGLVEDGKDGLCH